MTSIKKYTYKLTNYTLHIITKNGMAKKPYETGINSQLLFNS